MENKTYKPIEQVIEFEKESPPHTRIHNKTGIDLKYSNIDKISFSFFLSECMSFIVNFVLDRFNIFVCYVLYNINRDVKSIEAVGFAFTWGIFYFFFVKDFQEPIVIICGPFYSKKDLFRYKLFRNRLIMFNILFLIVTFGIFLVSVYPLYEFINVEKKNLDYYYWQTVYFCASNFIFETSVNFVRGKMLSIFYLG